MKNEPLVNDWKLVVSKSEVPNYSSWRDKTRPARTASELKRKLEAAKKRVKILRLKYQIAKEQL